jgi:hypothetical protein
MSEKCQSRTSVRLFDHLIRAGEQCRRNGKPQCAGGLEIDDQLQRGGLLDGKVSGSCTFQYLVHVIGCFAIKFGEIWPVSHQYAGRSQLVIVAH